MELDDCETIQVLTAQQTTDRYGDVSDDWNLPPTSRAVTTIAPLEPRPGDEPLQEARNAVVSGWTLYLPAGDPIGPQNRVSVRGETFPVQGTPARWPDGVIVQAFKTEG